jgi:hypothetical protein
MMHKFNCRQGFDTLLLTSAGLQSNSTSPEPGPPRGLWSRWFYGFKPGKPGKIPPVLNGFSTLVLTG